MEYQIVLLIIFTWQVTHIYVLSQSIATPGDVVAGRPFTLECRINRGSSDCNPLCSLVIWDYTDGQGVPILYATRNCTSSISLFMSSPAGLSGGCHKDNGEEVYRVRIENVTEDMERVRWRCQYSLDVLASVTLDVKVIVTKVTVQNLHSLLLVGTISTFTCVTSPSKPKACVRGYICSSDNVREVGSADCNQNSTSVQTTTGNKTNTTAWTTTRTLRFTASAEDNGAVLYCTANNSVTDPPVHSQNHSLKVQYTPRNGVILSSSYVNNTFIESGETVTLTCQVGKGNPPPSLSWTSGCGQTNTVTGNDGSQQMSIRLTASPSLNRKSCVCKATQDGKLTKWSQQKSLTFNVLFGPDTVELRSDSGQTGNIVSQTENSTVTFTCNSGECNPAAILSWYNNNIPITDVELSVVSSKRGPNQGYLITQQYTARVDRYQDGDIISCQAQRSDQTKPVSSSKLKLDILYPPEITCNQSHVTVFEGQTVTISCDVISKSETTVIWLRGNKQVDGASFKNTRHFGRSDGLITSLEFDAADKRSSGTYAVEARNGFGSHRMAITLTVIESGVNNIKQSQLTKGLGESGMFGVGLVAGVLIVTLACLCLTCWLRRRGALIWNGGAFDRKTEQDATRTAVEGSNPDPMGIYMYEGLDSRMTSGPEYEDLSGGISSTRLSGERLYENVAV